MMIRSNLFDCPPLYTLIPGCAAVAKEVRKAVAEASAAIRLFFHGISYDMWPICGRF